MKILIDTNIILEVILQRENFDVANHLLTALSDGDHKIFMTVGGFYEIQAGSLSSSAQSFDFPFGRRAKPS